MIEVTFTFDKLICDHVPEFDILGKRCSEIFILTAADTQIIAVAVRDERYFLKSVQRYAGSLLFVRAAG